MTLFTPAEREAVARAIAQAEQKTSGEIVAVVADASDDYLYVGLLWAALASLLVPLCLIWFTLWPAQIIYLAQLAMFVLLALVLQWRPLRHAVVPRSLQRARAHKKAIEQFLSQNLYTTRGRTGVLIFVSVAERFAEVIADEGIYKRAPRDCWTEIVNDLTAHIGKGESAIGFIRAIERCGALLANHFPPQVANPDELPNHLIEL